jgi:hypothetical protein
MLKDAELEERKKERKCKKVKPSRKQAVEATGVFPVRYEYHLHIKGKAIPPTGRGGPQVLPVRYEHHLHKK